MPHIEARLIYLMGPSGAGKDTLLRHARKILAGRKVLFARRYITRPLPVGAGRSDEKHVPLSEEEFLRKRDEGFFVLHWESHGLYYGIGQEINAALMQGHVVVVNGSREYLPEAMRRYPDLLPVLVDAAPEVLRARLRDRGREHGADLEERLRGASLPVDAQCVRIDNSGPLENALETLVTLLRGYGG